MSSWMRWLLMFLALRAEGDDPDPNDPDPNPNDDPNPDDDPDPGEDPDDLHADDPNATGDEPPARGPGRREQAVIDARRRAQDAERERDQARADLEAARRNQQQRPDPQWEEEERILKDPNADATQKYWVNANRTLRETRRDAALARMEASDARDISAYDAAAREYPLMSKYRDRVEQFVAEIRKNGGVPPPRQVLFDTLHGRDMREGKLKAAPKRRTDANATTTPNVNRLPADQRGNTVRARSDVSRRTQQTEQDRRRARLENQLI